MLAAEQQECVVSLDQDDPVSSIFNYDPESAVLTIKPEIESKLIAGKLQLEPGFYLLPFLLDSDILGKNTERIMIEIPEAQY